MLGKFAKQRRQSSPLIQLVVAFLVPSSLTEVRCEACAPGTPPISEEDARGLLREIDDRWEIKKGKRLVRRFKFPDFKQAFEFATAIAELAESEGHHPDLEIGWGRLEVFLTTHVAGGLTRNDFIMAAKIDELA